MHILSNGRIFTADPGRPWADSLAIQGDRIVAVGPEEDVLRKARSLSSSPQVVDLDGRVVVPGFNDAHEHLPGAWPPADIVDPGLEAPRGAVIHAAASAAAGRRKGSWVSVGASLPFLEDPLLDRSAVDSAVPDHPVWIQSMTGHAALLNTAALRALGLAEFGAARDGYDTDDRGRLTGWLREYALWEPLRRIGASRPDASILEVLPKYCRQSLQLGITSVQTMPIAHTAERTERLLRAAGAPLRWRIMRVVVSASERPAPPVPASADASVRTLGVKYILDGTPIERGAAIAEPYADRPGWTGTLDFSPDEVRSLLREARAVGEPILFHAEGDRAVDAVLDGMEALGDGGWRPRRVRIEHGDSITSDHVERMRRLGVVLVQNPTHFSFPAIFHARLGAERASRFMPLRSVLEGGVPVALGSDGPRNPFLNLMFAITHPTNPGEALGREEAVAAYTRGSAFAEFTEAEKGTLAEGMLADLAVLSQDIFTVDPGRLPATESLLTMVGGRVAYASGPYEGLARPPG